MKPLTQMPATLPDLSFVTPAYCNDMHGVKKASPTYPADCQIGTQALIRRGDSWLAAHVPAWLNAGAIAVIITFDEGNTKSSVGIGLHHLHGRGRRGDHPVGERHHLQPLQPARRAGGSASGSPSSGTPLRRCRFRWDEPIYRLG